MGLRLHGCSEENPSLVNLRDKEVAIIGTDATAIQVVPELAKWVKKLYVFQRTPSAVDIRGQHETDPVRWEKEIAARKGWQAERVKNFSSHFTNPDSPPNVNLVDDQWTRMPTYAAVVGNENGPQSKQISHPTLRCCTPRT